MTRAMYKAAKPKVNNSWAWPHKVGAMVKFDRSDPTGTLKVAYVCLTCSQALMFNGTEGSEVGRELRTHAALHRGGER